MKKCVLPALLCAVMLLCACGRAAPSGTAAEDFGGLIAVRWLVPFVRLFAYTALVNLNLAVFNLLPLPPLDGFRIAAALAALVREKLHFGPE